MRKAFWQPLLLLLSTLVHLRQAQPAPAQLSPDQIYVPRGFVPPTVLAPSVALGGLQLGAAAGAETAEECSARCLNATGCSHFQWCSTQVGRRLWGSKVCRVMPSQRRKTVYRLSVRV